MSDSMIPKRSQKALQYLFDGFGGGQISHDHFLERHMKYIDMGTLSTSRFRVPVEVYWFVLLGKVVLRRDPGWLRRGRTWPQGAPE